MADKLVRSIPDDTLEALNEGARATGQSVNTYLVSILEAHVRGPAPTSEPDFVPQHPTKAEPGKQVWHPGGLIAELQDLANKRGVELDSLLAGIGAIIMERRPPPPFSGPSSAQVAANQRLGSSQPRGR